MVVTVVSLIAAAVEGKADWFANLPAGIIVGGAAGWLVWLLFVRRSRHRLQSPDER